MEQWINGLKINSQLTTHIPSFLCPNPGIKVQVFDNLSEEGEKPQVIFHEIIVNHRLKEPGLEQVFEHPYCYIYF